MKSVNSKALFGAIFILIIYPAWFRGGTPPGTQPPLLVLSGVLLAMYLVANVWGTSAQVRGGLKDRASLSTAGRLMVKRVWGLLTRPVFLAGLPFVVLLLVQYINAGRFTYQNPVNGQWQITAPLHPSFPSAFRQAEAFEMICWFVPVWLLVSILRTRIFTGKSLMMILRCLTLNGAVIGVFGIVQFISGTSKIYWFTPIPVHFFASFGYPNHAASFFAFMLALNFGLLFHELARQREQQSRIWIWLLVVTTAIHFGAANLTLSRAGILLSWGLLGVAGLYFVARLWRQLAPVTRLNLACGIGAAMILAAILAWAIAGDEITMEIASLAPAKIVDGSTLGAQGRMNAISAAWKIALDNPFFGVGGWGYAHLVGFYFDPASWGQLHVAGQANVHNDLLQFLAEFGFVGTGILLLECAILGITWIRRSAWRTPLGFFGGMALLLIAAHSVVDLPFRSPAILIMVAFVLAAVPLTLCDDTFPQIKTEPEK